LVGKLRSVEIGFFPARNTVGIEFIGKGHRRFTNQSPAPFGSHSKSAARNAAEITGAANLGDVG